MRRYLRLLRAAPWAWLTSSIGRITVGMVVVGLVLMVRRSGYGYGEAGLVAGAHSVGIGVIGPLQGRLADRFGQRRVLMVDAVAYFVALCGIAGLAATGAPLILIMLVAVVAGSFNPPLSACARVAWRVKYGMEMREAAFSLDAVTIELGYILGPVLSVVLVESIAPVAGVVGAGVAALLGAGGFALTAESAAVVGAATGPRSVVGALRSVGVRWLLVLFLLVSVVFGVVDIVAPAVAEAAGRPWAAGMLLAVFAGGSLIGGVVYGSRDWPGTLVQRLRLFMLAFGLLLLATPITSGSLIGLGAALLLAGVAIAPMAIAIFQLVDEVAIAGTSTEALTWTTSANVAGAALGAVVAGFAVENGGTGWALGLGAFAVLLSAGLVWLLSERPASGLVATAP